MRNFGLLTLLVTLPALSTGCQEEEYVSDQPPPAESFQGTSPLAASILEVTSLDGSQDNIITGASCIAAVFPVTITINGQVVAIASEEGFSQVERIMDSRDDDDDIVAFAFPINIMLWNHQQELIQNIGQLETYAEQCTENGLDDDNECIDFIYPLNLSLYDSKTQSSETVAVRNDRDLYLFLDDMTNGVFISFRFPIQLATFDGSEIQVYNNIELQRAIDDADGACNEDDDNDFNDDDVDDSSLKSAMMGADWRITHFFDGADKTSFFDGWRFTFNTAGVIDASSNDSSLEGVWSTYGDSGVLELELEFNADEPFQLLEKGWVVQTYSDTAIELETYGEDITTEKLTFSRN